MWRQSGKRWVCASGAGLAFLVAACGSATAPSPPAPPGPRTVAQLLAAPTIVEADGDSLVLQTYLYRDFQPISPPGGKPLAALLQVVATDSATVSPALTADTVWIIDGSQMWQSAVQPANPPSTEPPTISVVARNGPTWGPDSTVDVVIQIHDGAASWLLRAPSQMIFRLE